MRKYNKSDNDSFVNHYFDVLKNKLKPKSCESLNEIINYVNEKYNLKLNSRVENDFFKMVFQSSSQNSPNPQISIVTVQDRIAALKDKCLHSHTNIIPPKI